METLDNDTSPPDDILKINDFSKLDRNAFNNFKEVSLTRLQDKKRRDSYIFKKWVNIISILFIGIIIFLFFLASFFSLIGWINNPKLADTFLPSFYYLISVVIGFALGLFYEKSNR